VSISTRTAAIATLAAAALVLQIGRVGAQDRSGDPGSDRAWPPTSPVTGSAKTGQQLYYAYTCYGCHGYGGETGAVAFVGSRSPNLATEDNFVRFLRGRANVAPELPSTRMPSYAERTMSDAQAKDIYAYIRTFRSHAPPLERIEVMKRILEAASER
jgi:mono/diheme cytochrome c family protein